MLEWCSVEGSSEVMVVSVPVLTENNAVHEESFYDGGSSSEQAAHGL